jgi:hypothetical protein
MYFDRVFITAEGYDLLGAATAGSSDGSSSPKIIWGSVVTSSVDISGWSASQINGATSDLFTTDTYTSSGAVTSAVPIQKEITVNDQTIKVNTVTVTIDINNNQHDGIANTLCVFAKLEDDEEDKLVIVASADNPETVHPQPQPYKAIIDLYIELSDTAVSEVSANSSWYASASAFNAIANRVVTTHSENSPTTGEDQVVYGVKTFKDDIHTSNVTPLNNLTVDLGDNAHNYKNVFARTVSQLVMVCSTAANTVAKLIVSEQTSNFSTPKSGDRIIVKFTNGNSSSSPSINIGGLSNQAYAINGLRTNLEENAIVPMTFNGSSWDVDGVSSVAKQVDVSVKSESSDYSVVFTDVATKQIAGTPRNRELYVDSNTDGTLKYNPGTNTLICTTFDGEATTATSAGKWTTARNFYITTSDGKYSGSVTPVDGSSNIALKLPSTIVIPSMTQIPMSRNFSKVDVGGIFLARVRYVKHNESNAVKVVHAGSTVTVSSSSDTAATAGDLSISQAEFNNDTGWASTGMTGSVPVGTYKFLSGLSLNPQTSHSMMQELSTGLALMMRIS